MAEALDKVFIDVEFDASVAGDAPDGAVRVVKLYEQ